MAAEPSPKSGRIRRFGSGIDVGRRRLLTLTGPHDIDDRCVKGGFDVRGIEFLDHFDGSSAVFGDSIDVGPSISLRQM